MYNTSENTKDGALAIFINQSSPQHNQTVLATKKNKSWIFDAELTLK